MRRIGFTRRLLITTTGASLGLLGIFLALAADRSTDVNSEGTAIFVAVAFTAALGGAAVTRRMSTAIIAAILAVLATPATFVLLIFAACSSGVCD
jgi:hypothetical protein